MSGFQLFLFILVHFISLFFFFQAEDGIRDLYVTGVQTCALPIFKSQRAKVKSELRKRVTASPFASIFAFCLLTFALCLLTFLSLTPPPPQLVAPNPPDPA